MRAGIGLIALLMGVALMFYLFTRDAETSVAAKKQAEETLNPIAGRTSTGKPITQTVTVEPGPKGAKVLTVEADSPLVTAFGLKAGDVVVEIGPFAPDQFADDQTARAFLSDAVAKNMPITVQRDGQRVTLEQKRPGLPGMTAGKGSPQDQLNDMIQKVPTH